VKLHAFVSGRVQGVSFRSSTRLVLNSLGLTGSAVNLSDGRVEVIAEGLRDKLDELLVWLHHGPPSARVSKVDFIFSVCS
jgi:acylphosphatase